MPPGQPAECHVPPQRCYNVDGMHAANGPRLSIPQWSQRNALHHKLGFKRQCLMLSGQPAAAFDGRRDVGAPPYSPMVPRQCPAGQHQRPESKSERTVIPYRDVVPHATWPASRMLHHPSEIFQWGQHAAGGPGLCLLERPASQIRFQHEALQRASSQSGMILTACYIVG